MGENTPEAVILTCPGCDTQFRLKPKKGRLPEGPVACPKCATDIPVVDSNLSAPDSDEAPRRETLSGDGPVPPSAKFDLDEEADEFARFPDDEHSFADINLSENATRDAGPKQTFMGMGPNSMKAVMGDESSTASPHEPTQLVDQNELGALRESSVVDESADDGGFQDSPTSGRLRGPKQLDEDEEDGENEFTRETSEQKSVTESDLREAAESVASDVDAQTGTFDDDIDEDIAEDEETEATDDSKDEDASTQSDSDDESDEDKSSSPGGKKNVLGKLKLKKKLATRLKRDRKKRQEESSRPDSEDDAPDTQAEESDASDESEDADEPPSDKITVDSEDQKTGKKPSLSELLKKARKKSKSGSGLPRPRQSTTRNKRPKPTGEKLDRALQDIADETAEALTDEEQSEAEETESSERQTKQLGRVANTDRLGKVSGPDAPEQDKRSSKEMMDLLRRKVAEKDQPGAASERRGSGYIRLPTAEIQDVLGQGTYRLRVENIVYEPVDKEGLTKLIKRGVLLGAADIATGDGDWMPIQEHPVFKELRSKMAKEAHDLLADYRAGSDEDDVREAEREATADDAHEAPGAHTSDQEESEPAVVETVTEAEAAGIPTLEAELEDDAAVDEIPELDEGEDEEPETELGAEDSELKIPAPTQTRKERTDEDPAPSDQSFDLPKSESSIEFPVDEPSAKQPGTSTRADSTEADASKEPIDAGTPRSYSAIDPNRPPAEDDADRAVAEDTRPSGGNRRGLIVMLSILAAAMVTITIAVSPLGRPYVEKYLGPFGFMDDDPSAPTDDANTANGSDDGQPEIGEAVNAAASTVSEAADVPLSNADEIVTRANAMVDAGDTASAATLIGVARASAPADPALASQHIDLLITAGRFTEARHVIAQQVARGESDAALEDAFVRATTSDPALGDYDTVSLSSGQNVDALRAYPTWEQMNFQVVEGGTVTGVFKPAQAGWDNAWRDEIAAWRLCEIMTCHFEVPRNRAARITRTEMETLVDAGSSESQSAYRDQLDSLEWQTETVDGSEVEVVYGALKDWPGEWAPFPIEVTDIWRPWLSVPGADLDQPVEQALAELKNVQGGRFYEQLDDELDGATTRSMARELSAILVFDYLTNNWDRFVGAEERYGVNNPFADGHFVSLNNGSAFQTRDSTRVKGRFSWTSRFSRSTVASLRLMAPEFVSTALYPDPTGLEEAKLEVFWEQRNRVLERVDELKQARGEDAVMAFD